METSHSETKSSNLRLSSRDSVWALIVDLRRKVGGRSSSAEAELVKEGIRSSEWCSRLPHKIALRHTDSNLGSRRFVEFEGTGIAGLPWRTEPESLRYALKQTLEIQSEYGTAIISDAQICEFIEATVAEVRATAAKSEEKESTEHEHTRELFIEKFSELAKNEDLLRAKDQIIAETRAQSREIQERFAEQIMELQSQLGRFLPHMRVFKTAFYFACLFLGSIFVDLLFNIKIIQPFWAALGAAISAGFIGMSYFMYLDWQEKKGP